MSVIKSYSWCDESDKVLVFIDLPEDARDVSAEGVAVSHSARSAELRIDAGARTHVLKLSGLHADISSASAKKGKARVTLSLVKAAAASWWRLLESSAPYAGGDDD